MRVALIAAIVTHVAVIAVVVLVRKPATIVHEQTTIPISLSVPVTVQAPPIMQTAATAVVAAPTARTCPPPRTDAPRAKTLHPPEDVHDVVASRTNAGWIAAWNDTDILVSTDAGVTFARVLDGPGTVHAVEFDCFGNVVALRDNQLGIREGTREHWQSVPGVRGDADSHAVLLGGGPDVVVIGIADHDSWRARLAVSPDRGATWWYRDLVAYWESAIANGYQASDGSIEVALTIADCMSDPVFWFRIHDGKVETDELGSIGHVALDGDRAYNEQSGELRVRRFGDDNWRTTKSMRAQKLMNGSVDPAGRVWSIAETKDGEAAWAKVAD